MSTAAFKVTGSTPVYLITVTKNFEQLLLSERESYGVLFIVYATLVLQTLVFAKVLFSARKGNGTYFLQNTGWNSLKFRRIFCATQSQRNRMVLLLFSVFCSKIFYRSLCTGEIKSYLVKSGIFAQKRNSSFHVLM